MFDELTSTAPAEEALLAIVDTAILDGVLRGAGRTAWHYPLTTDFPVTLTKLSLPFRFYQVVFVSAFRIKAAVLKKMAC
jgi:hypothetical protein